MLCIEEKSGSAVPRVKRQEMADGQKVASVCVKDRVAFQRRA